MIIKKCLCGKEFKTYPSKIKVGKGKYCSKSCGLGYTMHNLLKGAIFRFKKGQTHKWHKHRSINHSGYIEIYSLDHPFRTKRGYVKEHRLVAEDFLGRYLTKDEQIHHINGNKQDNRIENLQLVTHAEHIKIHGPLILKRWRKKEVLPDALH